MLVGAALKTQDAEKEETRHLSQSVVHRSVSDYNLSCDLDDLLDKRRPVQKKHERALGTDRKKLTIFSISAQRVSTVGGFGLRRRCLVKNV